MLVRGFAVGWDSAIVFRILLWIQFISVEGESRCGVLAGICYVVALLVQLPEFVAACAGPFQWVLLSILAMLKR